jgi:hypothetical protein
VPQKKLDAALERLRNLLAIWRRFMRVSRAEGISPP